VPSRDLWSSAAAANYKNNPVIKPKLFLEYRVYRDAWGFT